MGRMNPARSRPGRHLYVPAIACMATMMDEDEHPVSIKHDGRVECWQCPRKDGWTCTGFGVESAGGSFEWGEQFGKVEAIGGLDMAAMASGKRFCSDPNTLVKAVHGPVISITIGGHGDDGIACVASKDARGVPGLGCSVEHFF